MKRFKSIILLAAVTGTLSSCLKDKDIEDRKYGMEGVTDIQLVEITDAPEKVFTFEFADKDTTVQLLAVHLNTAEPAAEDIKVTLKLDQDVIDAYNDANSSHYELPPADAYSIKDLVVTVPKGSRDGYLTVTANSAKLSAGEFGLGFTIVSTSNAALTLSKNYKSAFVSLAVKNRYDGHYVVTGTLVDVQVPTISGKYPFEVDLETVDANTVLMYHTGSPFTGYYHPIVSGSSTSAYGNFAVVIEFNGDNIVDVYNGYGQGAGSRWGFLDPTGTNKIEAGTKNFKVKYVMNQPNASTLRTQYDETFKFVRAR